MTELNMFCYSEKYGDDSSIHQVRYRAFNKVVGPRRFNEILKLVQKILLNGEPSFAEYWNLVTVEQWKKMLEIPEAVDFKQGFEYISGTKILLE